MLDVQYTYCHSEIIKYIIKNIDVKPSTVKNESRDHFRLAVVNKTPIGTHRSQRWNAIVSTPGTAVVGDLRSQQTISSRRHFILN